MEPPPTQITNVRPVLDLIDSDRATSTTFDAFGADAYLRSLAMEPGAWLSAQTAESAIGLLRYVRGALGPGLRIPLIAPAVDGSVGFTWRNSRYYVNVRLDPSGEIEFFFEDLVTGELWSAEGRRTTEGMLTRLRLVA
jgi:hypothetical protein